MFRFNYFNHMLDKLVQTVFANSIYITFCYVFVQASFLFYNKLYKKMIFLSLEVLRYNFGMTLPGFLHDRLIVLSVHWIRLSGDSSCLCRFFEMTFPAPILQYRKGLPQAVVKSADFLIASRICPHP